MIRCTRCGRRMKRQTESGLGPRCQLAVLGSKQKRRRVEAVRVDDERQGDLFEEVR